MHILEYDDFARLGTYLHELSMSVISLLNVRYKALLIHH